MAVYKSKKTTKDNRAWYFSTYYVDLDGINKKKKSKKYNLKKEAEEAERIFLMSYKEQSIQKITFKELIEDYINYQKDKVKISSFRNYYKYSKHLEPLYKININDFSIKHFNIWKDKILKEDYSVIYKNNIYKFLRAILTYAIKYHNCNNLNVVLNKMVGFKNPNELKKEMQFYSFDEFKKYIDQEQDLKFKCYFETLYYCGLRKGEANALTWKDIDFEKKTMIINKNLTQKIKGEKYTILPPKTKSSIRLLPIPDILLNNLLKLKKEYIKYENFNKNWFVFGGINPLADTTIQKRNENNAKNAKLKHIRIHDFRHSCASLLINNNASISLVAKYLGHSNITTTLNTYTHMFKNELSDIINIINKL